MTTKLTQLTMSGFKSIAPEKPLTIELGDVTVLLGANGSGKSNIINFFKMMSFMMTGNFQSYIAKTGTSEVFFYYGLKHTEHIDGKLLFEDKNNKDTYQFSLTHAVPDTLIFNSEVIEWQKEGDDKPFKLPLELNFKESALLNYKSNQTAHVIYKRLANCKVYQFHDSSPESKIRQASHKDLADYLQAEGGNLAAFLYRLKEKFPAYYGKIIRYIQQVMPQFHDFYLEPNEKGFVMLKWTDNSPDDYMMLPQQFSDGTIRFIALATLLLQPPETMPNLILIDEPELGLHPYAINQLGYMIKAASEHAQVVVATQSPGLVDEFEANQVTVVEKDEEKGCTIAHKLNEDDLKAWLKDYSLGQLWNKGVFGGQP
ncbi:MAG: AAA family ATPase [Tannerella sp.]|jgi:predicted ATPase|nr:AAA family ATPase [Tannerella sp.]